MTKYACTPSVQLTSAISRCDSDLLAFILQAPTVVNSEEYAFELHNKQVDGIDVAITTDSVRAKLAEPAAPAAAADEGDLADPEEADVSASIFYFLSIYIFTSHHCQGSRIVMISVLADPIAAAILHAKPVAVGRGSGPARVEDTIADQLEAETGQHVFRKAKKRTAPATGAGAVVVVLF
jgi:hypothetical protein